MAMKALGIGRRADSIYNLPEGGVQIGYSAGGYWRKTGRVSGLTKKAPVSTTRSVYEVAHSGAAPLCLNISHVFAKAIRRAVRHGSAERKVQFL